MADSTAVIAANMKRLRRSREWTAEQLGAQMHKHGVAWNRQIVAKLEIGRRASVSVDELLALAAVFGVEPMKLLQEDLPITW